MNQADGDTSGPISRGALRGAGNRRKRAAILIAATSAALGISGGAVGIADAGTTSSKTTASAVSASHWPFGGPDGWRNGFGPAVIGTVKSVGTNAFTVTTPGKTTVTVDVTRGTTYRDRTARSATLASVTAGEHVLVLGKSASGTVTASRVIIGIPGPFGVPGGPGGFGRPGGFAGWRKGFGPAVAGTVKSVGRSSFTVTTPGKTAVTVHVTSATSYRDPKTSSATLASVTAGEHVLVLGKTTSGTVTASQVLIGIPGRFGAPGPFGHFGGFSGPSRFSGTGTGSFVGGSGSGQGV